MARKLACVFGGSGFIGRHVVRRLAAKGLRVRVAVRDTEAALFLRPMGDVAQVEPIHINVADAQGVAAAVAGAEIVINAAGVLNGNRRNSFPTVNVIGPANIAEASSRAGVHALVHLSALSAKFHANSHYARSKIEGEDHVRAAFPAATILRPSFVFGPEDSFFNRFAGIASLSPFLPIIGYARFQPVYVGDVADAVIAACENPALAGKTFSLGGPRIYTMPEMMTMMLATMQRRRKLVRFHRGMADIIAMLPGTPLTLDQVAQLYEDNVVPPGAPGLAELGIAPTSLEAMLPTILSRYRNRYVPVFPA